MSRFIPTKDKRLEFSLKLTFDSLILLCVLDNICFGEDNLTALVFFMKIKRGEMELFRVSLLFFHVPTLFPENYGIENDGNRIKNVHRIFFFMGNKI